MEGGDCIGETGERNHGFPPGSTYAPLIPDFGGCLIG